MRTLRWSWRAWLTTAQWKNFTRTFSAPHKPHSVHTALFNCMGKPTKWISLTESDSTHWISDVKVLLEASVKIPPGSAAAFRKLFSTWQQKLLSETSDSINDQQYIRLLICQTQLLWIMTLNNSHSKSCACWRHRLKTRRLLILHPGNYTLT